MISRARQSPSSEKSAKKGERKCKRFSEMEIESNALFIAPAPFSVELAMILQLWTRDSGQVQRLTSTPSLSLFHQQPFFFYRRERSFLKELPLSLMQVGFHSHNGGVMSVSMAPGHVRESSYVAAVRWTEFHGLKRGQEYLSHRRNDYFRLRSEYVYEDWLPRACTRDIFFPDFVHWEKSKTVVVYFLCRLS